MTELIDYIDDFTCLMNTMNPTFTRINTDYDLKKLLTNPIRKNSSIDKLVKDGILPIITQADYDLILTIVNKFKKSKSSCLCRERAIKNNNTVILDRYNSYTTKEYRKQVRAKRADSIKIENRNVYLKRVNRSKLMKELKEVTMAKYGDSYGSHIKNFTDTELDFHINGNYTNDEGDIISTIPDFKPFSMLYVVEDNLKYMHEWAKGHYETGLNGESVFVPYRF